MSHSFQWLCMHVQFSVYVLVRYYFMSVLVDLGHPGAHLLVQVVTTLIGCISNLVRLLWGCFGLHALPSCMDGFLCGLWPL